MDQRDARGLSEPVDHVDLERRRKSLRVQVHAAKMALDPRETSRGERVRAVSEEPRQPVNVATVVPKRRTVALAAANLPPTQTRIFNGVIALFALAVCSIVLWGVINSIATTERSAPPATTAEQLSHTDASSAFAAAFGDLYQAMEASRDQRPEDILREAAKRDQSCRLQWNDGRPAFLYGGDLPRRNALSLEIEHCAEAVRRLHPE